MIRKMTIGFALIAGLTLGLASSAEAQTPSFSLTGVRGTPSASTAFVALPVQKIRPASDLAPRAVLPGYAKLTRVIQIVQAQPVMVTPWCIGFFQGFGLQVSGRM